MQVLNFIIGNWDNILAIIVAITIAILTVVFGGKKKIFQILYYLVTEAEKELGSGTGALKKNQVMAQIYDRLPTLLKTFISIELMDKWIEQALSYAKDNLWSKK